MNSKVLFLTIMITAALTAPAVAHGETPVEEITTEKTQVTPLELSRFRKAKAGAAPIVVGENAPRMKDLASKTTKAFFYFIAAVLLGATIYKKFIYRGPQSSDEQAMTVLSRMPLGPKSTLLLVDVDGTRLLLAQTADSVTMLSEIASHASFDDALQAVVAEDGIQTHSISRAFKESISQ